MVQKRPNTSIVTYAGSTWYVANIDFMTPAPDCIHDGTSVTLTGRLTRATEAPGPDVIRPGYVYDLVLLDRAVCFLGNLPEPHGTRVALVATRDGVERTLARFSGKHVVVSGVLTSPDNGDQPPESMLIFDPTLALAH